MRKENIPSKKLTLVINSENIQTMATFDIAELTGKRHDHVIRDVRKMLSELDSPNLGNEQYQELTDARGFTRAFLLNEELTLTLVSGYNIKMRNAIIRRWKELEKEQSASPEALCDALRLAADSIEENSLLKPKAAALDRLNSAKGYSCLREAAKQLNLKPKVLNEWLETNGWCYRNEKGERIPYQRRIDSGLMSLRCGEKNGHSFSQALISPKGLIKLAHLSEG